MKKEWRMYSYAAIVGCTGGGLIGSSVAIAAEGAEGAVDARATAARHGARTAERAARNGPSGAVESIDVTPVFDSLRSENGAASAVFHVEVDDVHAGGARVAYAWQLSDENGAVLASRDGAEVGRLAAGGVFASEAWDIQGLKEGLYRVHFTVVADGQKPGSAAGLLRDWWLEVSQGSIQEISASAWLLRSKIGTRARPTVPSTHHIANDTPSQPGRAQK